ncbi:MAG TPA: ImmA/IrrE family metallo-endopeptidase [Candidatus Aminicenantes bacterium]|nr:ImmA/IrrE family metallo-endopeptidase [Candidatus Aminicenantes bacterium]
MGADMIPVNLRRLREARRITQGKLAKKASLSRVAYRNIETGKSVPRVRTLEAIAAALQVPLAQLVAPARELKAVRFRSNKQLRLRAQILADVERWLHDFNALEQMLGDKKANLLPKVSNKIPFGAGRAKAAASMARATFGLDNEEPVRDICGLLESAGVKVGEKSIASSDFFGLSVAEADGGPAVFVNTWKRITVERWIFTAAHELGHLVLHLADFSVEQADEIDAHEIEANTFAVYFLMPDVSFRKEWEDTAGLAFIDRVLKVKRIFRVSYLTVLHRLSEGDKGYGKRLEVFLRDYEKKHNRLLLKADEPEALAQDALRAGFPESRSAKEPENLSRADFFQDRLSMLVRRAVENETISLGRGAEILGKSMADMRELAASWID